VLPSSPPCPDSRGVSRNFVETGCSRRRCILAFDSFHVSTRKDPTVCVRESLWHDLLGSNARRSAKETA
jgi:hypothetical protein